MALRADIEQCETAAVSQIGYVLTAVSVAACAYRHCDSAEEALQWAVSLGGDTDTNAAVCGALMGALFGADALPARWTEQLTCRAELRRLAADILV